MNNIIKKRKKIIIQQESSLRELSVEEIAFIHGGLGRNHIGVAFVVTIEGILASTIGSFNTLFLNTGIIIICANRAIGKFLFPNNQFLSRMCGMLSSAASFIALYSGTKKEFSINPFDYLNNNKGTNTNP